MPKEVQWENILQTLEWKEPKRLCDGPGMNWDYQGASDIIAALTISLVEHYDALKDENYDKSMHALNLVVSGPGTGKSRMLDEMKNLLCEAAVMLENQELVDRMKKAYVFNVSFENDTAAVGSLLDYEDPEYDVSYRMLY